MSTSDAFIDSVSAQNDVKLEAGSPIKDNTFDEYGIKTVPVMAGDNVDTGRRFIFRDGEFLADVSGKYNLLPNEEVLKIADDVADDLGASKFTDFDGDWYCPLEDHAITDEEGRRLHAMYAWNEDTVGGDDMNYGFIIHNSIDASLGFSVGLFSFRHACSNMVWMGAGKQQSGMGFDDRNILRSYYHRHTQGLETDADELKTLIENTVGVIPDIHDTYSDWVDSSISVSEVKELRERLPHQDLPEWVQEAIEAVEEARAETDEDEELDELEANMEYVDRMPDDEDKWGFYNDITESVWHSDTTNDNSKSNKMKKTHRVLTPAQGVR